MLYKLRDDISQQVLADGSGRSEKLPETPALLLWRCRIISTRFNRPQELAHEGGRGARCRPARAMLQTLLGRQDEDRKSGAVVMLNRDVSVSCELV